MSQVGTWHQIHLQTGSILTLKLPDNNPTLAAELAEIPESAEELTQGNRHILVVDDDNDVIDAYREVLCRQDQLSKQLNSLLQNFDIQSQESHYPEFAVDFAHSGEEAIEQVKRAQENHIRYSVIFMDVRMPPGMDGIEAAQQIRQLDESVYVVFVSAYADYPAYEMQCKLEKNILLLPKPFEEGMMQQMAHTLSVVWQREQNLNKQHQQLRSYAKLMEHQATHDSLTRIYNRHYLDMVLSIEIKRAQRESSAVGVLMIDLDWFKQYNDHFGHLRGDETLRRVAQCIAAQLQRPGDFVARYGGEEFTVVLPNTEQAGVEVIAEKIREAVESMQIENGNGGWVTISIGGLSCSPSAVTDPDFNKTLLKEADHQLYQAKNRGKNCVQIHACKA